jgi:thiol-disulfide isomerase/thioredoxin
MLTLAVGLAAAPMDDGHIQREGEGEHRAALDAAELTPFDMGLLVSLSDWRNGGPIESLDGGVMAIVFWSNDEAASVRTVVPTLKRLEMSYGSDGLTTLAVHTGDAWDGALERIESGLISTPTARDADGAFAAALGADDVPDVFLIDRAGQLRFADIDQRQLPTAVRGLLRETREEAAGAGARRAEAASAEQARAEKEAAARAERDARRAEDVKDLPPRPEESAYAAAAWPEPNKPKDPKNLYAKDMQGKPLAVPFGKTEKWLTEEVPLEGRVIVLDFWATWCGPCIAASPRLDALQKKYPEDLRVVGVSGQNDNEAKVRSFVDHHKVSYSHVFDAGQAVYRSLQINAIPHVVVLSSDGVVRWQGLPNADFNKAVDQVIASDPWVKARHEKE